MLDELLLDMTVVAWYRLITGKFHRNYILIPSIKTCPSIRFSVDRIQPRGQASRMFTGPGCVSAWVRTIPEYAK